MFVNSITIAGRASFSVLEVDNQTGEPVPRVKIEGSFLNFPKGWNESAKDLYTAPPLRKCKQYESLHSQNHAESLSPMAKGRTCWIYAVSRHAAQRSA